MSTHELMQLALAFYRLPARFPELRDAAAPLPGDVLPLLRIANGAPPAGLGIPAALGADEELQDAARFFIEQALLAPGADYYRLHGLRRDAAEDAIKEHHRLLMRLLHPDRVNADRDWQFAAAMRINQAYATLKDPARRRDYDLTLAAAAARAPAPAAGGGPLAVRRRARAFIPQRAADTPLRRRLWRHLPSLVMAGVLLVASASVALIWVTQHRSGALGGGGQGGRIVAADAEGRFPSLVEAVTQQDEGHLGLAETMPGAAGRLAEAHAGLPARPAGRPPRPPAAALPPPAEQAAVAAHAGPVPTRIADLRLKPLAVLPMGPQGPPPAPVRTPPDPAPAEPAPVAAGAGEALAPKAAADPADLLGRFVQRYELGDIDEFMALFADHARHETGGRDAIRSDYEDLFDGTVQRRMGISGMRWSPIGDGWRGEGRFRASVQRKGEAFQRLYVGSLRVEVGANDGTLRINGLYHKLADQGGD